MNSPKVPERGCVYLSGVFTPGGFFWGGGGEEEEDELKL